MALQSGYTNIADIMNNPSVQWLRQRSQESNDWFQREYGQNDGRKYNPDELKRSIEQNPNDWTVSGLNKNDPELNYHLGVVGELAKRNPQVLYETGFLNDGVNRINPNAPKLSSQELQEQLGQGGIYGPDTTNPQFQYRIGQPEPQQPSFQAQQGAEQPGQVWQQGLQQAIQDGSIREYLDKTVYKRETEAERKKRDEEEKKKQALTQMGDKTKGYTSTPYQMQFTPVNTLLR